MVDDHDMVISMRARLRRVCRTRRNNYEKLLDPETAGQLSGILSQRGRLASGLLEEINRDTGIPLSTLKHWRRKLQKGQDPFDYSWRRRPVSLSQENEDRIFEAIMDRIWGLLPTEVRNETRFRGWSPNEPRVCRWTLMVTWLSPPASSQPPAPSYTEARSPE